MAINPVAQADASQVAAQAVAAANTNQTQPAAQEAAPANTQPAAAVTDTVKISTAAQEAAETAAQTAQEANHGDRQAQRLLAKHDAEKAVLEGNKQTSILQPK